MPLQNIFVGLFCILILFYFVVTLALGLILFCSTFHRIIYIKENQVEQRKIRSHILAK